MRCLECGKDFKSITGSHLKVCCGLTVLKYKEKHGVDCVVSDLVVTTARQLPRTGVLNPFYGKSHTEEFKKKKSEHSKELWNDPEYRRRSTRRNCKGENNPFYGKKHSEEYIAQKRITSSEQMKKQWQDPEFRERNIKAMSGPKREGFKEKCSEVKIQGYRDHPEWRENKVKWYKDNPEQIELRRQRMAENWEKGLFNDRRVSCSFGGSSKAEKRLYEGINKGFPVEKTAIKDSDGRWLFPDIISPMDMFIIEFYGDFWHANPKLYSANDVIFRGMTAQDIWNHDKDRISRLEDLGYWVDIVWESDFKKDPEYIINYYTTLLNWESCAF